MKQILFSAVGTSDPILNYHDGAILHIIRNYENISDVYLYFTEEMWEVHEKKDFYRTSVSEFSNSKKRIINVKYINMGIDNPHNFNHFYDFFKNEMKRILDDIDEETEIIINISSGTPAIKTNLLLIGTEFSPGNVKCVQVTHPGKAADKAKGVVNEKYDFDAELINNIDEQKNTRRCEEVESESFFKFKVKNIIKSGLEMYDYNFLSLIINQSQYPFHTRAFIAYLKKRNNLDSIPASDINYLKNKYLNIDFTTYDQTLEYFLILKNIQKAKKISEFLLRMNPLILDLIGKFIEKKNTFVIENILTKRNEIKYLDKNKFSKENSNCYEYVRSKLGAELKDTPLSIRVANVILEFLNKDSNDSKIKEIMEDFKELEKINKLRDILAHTLESFDDSTLEKKTNVKSEEIIEKIEKIIKYIYGNKVSSNVYSFYDDANQCLLDNF